MPDDRALLEDQVRAWTSRGLLDSAAGDRLLADIASGFGVRATEAPQQSRFSVGVWILFSLGTVALAAALGVWFAREWGEWGRWLRVFVSLAVPTALAVAGFYFLSEGPRYFPALGKVFLTLTAVATLSATNLLAATYDFHPRHATMTFLEAGLFGVLAFLAGSALLLWTAVITLSVAFGFEIYSSWGWTWLSIERPIPFVGLGFAVVVLALLLRTRHVRLGSQLLVAGALMAQLALFFLSLKSFDYQEPRPTTVAVASWVVLFLPFLISLLLLVAVGYRSGGEASFARAVLIPLFSLLLLFALSSLWPERFYQRSWVDTVLFTLATLAAVIFGVQVRSAGVINVAVVFFAVDVFARFSEWFWDEMPAVYFFGLMGVLLILGGILLERVRRRLIRRIAEAV
jgi:uncharacterized membrane protein